MDCSACPVCGAEVVLPEGTVAGEVLICDGCAGDLEVMSLDPLKLDVAPEDEEEIDWCE